VTEPLPPVALAISFVDQINHRDPDRLAALMSTDHRLEVFGEDPVVGRDATIDAWRGYFAAFPRYVIHPHRIVEQEGSVAIVGHTTGSHLGLADDEERELTVIWIADTAGGTLSRWRLLEDTAANRRAVGLDED
jgi:hypothetical protein